MRPTQKTNTTQNPNTIRTEEEKKKNPIKNIKAYTHTTWCGDNIVAKKK